MADLQQLNPEQRRAVLTTEGRVLILAGAGSGKTRVLITRMAYLINVKKISPDSILGLTFTNKAANEMRQRMAAMVEPKLAKSTTLCTFHSFCMQVLRQHIPLLGYTKSFTLYDGDDVRRLVQQIAREELEHDGPLPSLEPTLAAISSARSRGISSESKEGWHDAFAGSVHEKLEQAMRAHNAVDFDTLLSLTVKLFREHPPILSLYQERYRYIMIDEYQDTNPIQYQLATLLSEKYGNLCVVGDDDQSIYGWRGADLMNILRFDNAAVIKLEQNYRSTNLILKAANAVIKKNTKRHPKELWSSQEGGTPIEIFHMPTDVEEAEAVVHRMARLREEKGLRWSDMAILYRSNSLSRLLEAALMKYTWRYHDMWKRGIPYRIFGGQEFYSRREIKDLLGYLRVIQNPLDQEAILRIINLPRRGIGETTLDALTAINRREGIPLWTLLKAINEGKPMQGIDVPDRALKGIKEWIGIVEEAQKRFATSEIHSAMKWLVEEINYKKAIQEEVQSEKMRGFKWENVEEFISALADYEEDVKEEGKAPNLQEFLSNAVLDINTPAFIQKEDQRGDKVTLMTFHSAKGLEFTACFLIGLEDHIIPHEKSLKETGIEEERRLMYVALTRAKQYLICSMARSRKRMGKTHPSSPSRFLFDIPKELRT